jgi:(E)-4-hydroxy-3-methylbut-2-enyl-diphosphate synthase
VPTELAGAAVACTAVSGRIAVEIDPATPAHSLAAAAREALTRDIALEWCCRAEPEEIDRCVAAAAHACQRVGALHQAFSALSSRPTFAARALALALVRAGLGDLPILLRYAAASGGTDDATRIDASIDLGGALCDGIGDAVSLAGFSDPARAVDLAYRVLQGSRLRTTRTEYISCPSCGRTLFDLEKTTALIKQKTAGLKGVKIAVMGCIVNGPGEMADADFGYVGAGPGVVSLYVGKQVVERRVPEAEAADRLVELIRVHGKWDGAG